MRRGRVGYTCPLGLVGGPLVGSSPLGSLRSVPIPPEGAHQPAGAAGLSGGSPPRGRPFTTCLPAGLVSEHRRAVQGAVPVQVAESGHALDLDGAAGSRPLPEVPARTHVVHSGGCALSRPADGRAANLLSGMALGPMRGASGEGPSSARCPAPAPADGAPLGAAGGTCSTPSRVASWPPAGRSQRRGECLLAEGRPQWRCGPQR